MTTFVYAQSPGTGTGTQTLPPAPPVAGPGPGSVGIAGPGAGIGIAGPGVPVSPSAPIGIAGPGVPVSPSAPIGIAGPGAPAPLPGSSGFTTVAIDGLLSPNVIGIAGDDNLAIGIATDSPGIAPRAVAPPVATTPGQQVTSIAIGVLGPIDATRARISRSITQTRVPRVTIVSAARNSFEGRVLIRGDQKQIRLVRRGD